MITNCLVLKLNPTFSVVFVPAFSQIFFLHTRGYSYLVKYIYSRLGSYVMRNEKLVSSSCLCLFSFLIFIFYLYSLCRIHHTKCQTHLKICYVSVIGPWSSLDMLRWNIICMTSNSYMPTNAVIRKYAENRLIH